METKPTIGVIGLSHLGIVASAGLASFGLSVIGADVDADTVEMLQKGNPVVPEPGLKELFATHNERLTVTTDFSKISDCDVVFLAKDTPTDEENNAMDLEPVVALFDAAMPYPTDGVEVVVMSQVPVGFTRSLTQRIVGERLQLNFSLCYFVETLVIGNAVARWLTPERLMFGLVDPERGLSRHLARIVKNFESPVFCMKLESAELCKAAINLYLATSVTYANTLANICEVVGADISEMIPALRLDKRIGLYAYIKPGLGLSGGHLERDLSMLTKIAAEKSARARLIDVIEEESRLRYEWLSDAIQSVATGKGSRLTIALWGLSYKKNTDSVFRAPSMRVIREFGKANDIIAYDPQAVLPEEGMVKRVNDKYEAVEDADCLLVLCDWDEFAEIDFGKIKSHMKSAIIIDGLGVFYGKKIPAGITYRAMGVSYSG